MTISHYIRCYLTFVLPVALLGCTPPQLGDSEAALALEDIVAGADPSRLKSQTAVPLRRSVNYVIDTRSRSGDLYLSSQGARAGIVLVPGVMAKGKDDHRLIALANTLARLRFAVFVPDIKGLRRFQTRASDVREVADAFRYLISQPELVPQGRAGLLGFSYGGGILLLASLEPDIREKVYFLMGFGGYHSIQSMVTYFTTGYYRKEEQGEWLYRHPHYYLKWVFALSNAELLERPEDRAALRAYAYDNNDVEENDNDFSSSNLATDAQALYALLSNEDPHHVEMLIDNLSPRIRDELEGINPAARDLSKIRAKVILLHGRGDTMIPYTESIAVARALKVEQVKLFIIEGYAHTDVRPKRKDIPQLLVAMETLLAQRSNTSM